MYSKYTERKHSSFLIFPIINLVLIILTIALASQQDEVWSDPAKLPMGIPVFTC